MKKKKSLRITLILLSALLLLGGLVLWLFTGSYPAGDKAKAALVSDELVTVTEFGSLTVFEPQSYERGIIFYPGGRVDHKAYSPLMRELAETGYLCVLVAMPLDFAFLNADGADEAREMFPNIQSWVIGGHSLGGVMAANYAAENAEKYDTLLLLASYTTENISDAGFNVISIYGENDGVLNFDNYEKNKTNLPVGTKEYVIDGGNHAMFGDYGHQKGDGVGSISSEEQIAEVIKILSNDY